MGHDQIESILKHSPSVRLLRARKASFIISFLYKVFKEPNEITIPNAQLVEKLADYQPYLDYYYENENVLEAPYIPAKQEIEEWRSDENNYLIEYTNEQGVDVHELTSHTEKVIQWLQYLNKREFIGTESRFLDIFHKLREIIEKSTEDPEKKLESLEKEKQNIEEQIWQIKADGYVEAFNDTQIKERVYEVNRSARELLADFNEVKQNLGDIVKTLYEKQANKESRKGQMLGEVLDATEHLKESDQGKSFYAFWQFLMDSSRQEELKDLVDQIYELLDNRGIEYSDTFLRKMKRYLHIAGEKVLDSTHFLAKNLQRILVGQRSAERKRTVELIGEIKKLAVQSMENPPNTTIFFAIDGDPEIQLPMERPLARRSQETIFTHHPFRIEDQEDVDFDPLFDQFEINKEQLEQNIRKLLKERSQIALTEVLQHYPLENGLAEVLTYLSIASHPSRHIINKQTYESICLSEQTARMVNIPQVIFTR